MTINLKQHIFFVDDEPQIRKAVAKTLEQLDVEVSCFGNATDCLESLSQQVCDLLITDVKMPRMGGIELLSRAKRIIPPLRVLVITGYGDIPVAVRAMKAGASDFIEKPLDRQSFLATVESLLKQAADTKPTLRKPLTQTEMKIFHLILEGKNNREMAELLHRSTRTVEDHRYSIFCKFGVTNIVQLVKKAAQMNLINLAEPKISRLKSRRTKNYL